MAFLLAMDFWQKQILRADALIDTAGGSNELLVFYSHLLRAQSAVSEYLRSRALSGQIQQDLPVLRPALTHILSAAEHGPTPLIERARSLKTVTTNDIDDMLLDYWHEPSDTEFFAKALLQPYGEYVWSTGGQLLISERRCPFCGGKPQLSVLQNKETTAESGNRDLMCAKCLAIWPFRRAVCANCGEEQPSKIGYFHSSTIDHVRVEACDTCKHYLKAVDLTRLGIAQPLVDEVSAAALDLWATEHGYTKIELNLLGL